MPFLSDTVLTKMQHSPPCRLSIIDVLPIAVNYAVRAAGSSTAVVASPEEGAVVRVGSGQPVKAFQVALKSMKQGEKASLKIKPECKLSCLPILPPEGPPAHFNGGRTLPFCFLILSSLHPPHPLTFS